MTNLTTIPLTGIQFRISAGDYSATVTELGAGLREFRYRDRPVIAQYEPDELPPGAAGQLLSPWPNRIDGGQYAFGGASYQLDLSEPAQRNAIHGLTRWAGWRVAAHAAEAVRLRHVLHGRPGYPFCLEGQPEDVTGTPYDFREPRLVADTVLDHALTGFSTGPDGRAWAGLSGAGVQVAFWAGEGYRWLQVFTGDGLEPSRRRRAIAVEPMTCPPNSFATGTDLLTLQPGESVTHAWGIQVRQS